MEPGRQRPVRLFEALLQAVGRGLGEHLFVTHGRSDREAQNRGREEVWVSMRVQTFFAR